MGYCQRQLNDKRFGVCECFQNDTWTAWGAGIFSKQSRTGRKEVEHLAVRWDIDYAPWAVQRGKATVKTGKLEWSHIAYALISFTEQTSQSRWPLTLMKDQREVHGCHSNGNVQMLLEDHVSRRSPDGLAKSPFTSSDQNPPRMFHWVCKERNWTQRTVGYEKCHRLLYYLHIDAPSRHSVHHFYSLKAWPFSFCTGQAHQCSWQHTVLNVSNSHNLVKKLYVFIINLLVECNNHSSTNNECHVL